MFERATCSLGNKFANILQMVGRLIIRPEQHGELKYNPPKSVAWTRNVYLLSDRLSEARSARSEKVKVRGG
jgi:hypothetical protein